MITEELDDGAPEVQAWLDERRRLTQILEQAAMDLFAHMGCEHALLGLPAGKTLLVRIEHA